MRRRARPNPFSHTHANGSAYSDTYADAGSPAGSYEGTDTDSGTDDRDGTPDLDPMGRDRVLDHGTRVALVADASDSADPPTQGLTLLTVVSVA